MRIARIKAMSPSEIKAKGAHRFSIAEVSAARRESLRRLDDSGAANSLWQI